MLDETILLTKHDELMYNERNKYVKLNSEYVKLVSEYRELKELNDLLQDTLRHIIDNS